MVGRLWWAGLRVIVWVLTLLARQGGPGQKGLVKNLPWKYVECWNVAISVDEEKNITSANQSLSSVNNRKTKLAGFENCSIPAKHFRVRLCSPNLPSPSQKGLGSRLGQTLIDLMVSSSWHYKSYQGHSFLYSRVSSPTHILCKDPLRGHYHNYCARTVAQFVNWYCSIHNDLHVCGLAKSAVTL